MPTPSSDWSALETQFRTWTASAQEQALRAATQLAGKPLEGDAAAQVRQALATGTDSAWSYLQGQLDGLTQSLIAGPSPTAAAEFGALNPDTLVPTGMLRAALGIAGGAPLNLMPDYTAIPDSAQVITAGMPIGQIGTGATISEVIELAAEREAYEWEHGPALNPFEPHLELDGQDFEAFDSDTLANPDSFPGNAFFFPGDHQGCTCDFVCLWVPREPTTIPEVESEA